MLSPWIAIALLQLARVEGATTCPAPEQVQASLSELGVAPGSSADVARLESAPEGLVVELKDASGARLARHVLDAGSTCDDLARACAVLIATWESEIPRAATAPSLPSPPTAPAIERAAARAPAWGWELGVGIGGSWSSAVAAAAEVHFSARPPVRWSLDASLSGETARTLSLAPGSVDWQRYSLGLGAGYVLLQSVAELRLNAEALLSALQVSSAGFTQDGSALKLDPGARVSLRLAWPARTAWSGWIGLSAAGWPLLQRGDVVNVGSVLIPRAEAGIALGGSFGRQPR